MNNGPFDSRTRKFPLMTTNALYLCMCECVCMCERVNLGGRVNLDGCVCMVWGCSVCACDGGVRPCVCVILGWGSTDFENSLIYV